LEWLQKISITCFAASYLVVLGIELSRVFFHMNLRQYVRIGLTAAGLFAHTVFLAYHTQLSFDSQGIWLGSWFGWCLSGAWVLAAMYLWLSLRKPNSLIGMFLLPVMLLLIAFGSSFANAAPFSPGRAKTVWNMIHGTSLLLGTVVVAMGFVFGIMYLIQSRRLKQKRSGSFRLPSLEWLNMWAERTLFGSAVLLCGGFASGIALKMVQQSSATDSIVGGGTIPWSDPVIWTSAVLFLWLLAATIISVFYKPVRRGRKVAYVVTISFLFLLLELVIVWQVGHATEQQTSHSPHAQWVTVKQLSRKAPAAGAGRWKNPLEKAKRTNQQLAPCRSINGGIS
jgi:hypothetical protein